MSNKGDKIAAIAQPITRGFDWMFGTDLQNCGGCKAMQNNLNAGMNFADALYDRFWKNNPKEKQMQEYLVIKQIAVMADTPEEAIQKIAEGKTISMSVQQRPQLPTPRPIQPQPAAR